MKSGLALVELATELERQSETKKDFVASTSVLEMTPEGELTKETETSSNEFPLTDNCHAQIATKLDIQVLYYNRMRKEAPELLATKAIYQPTDCSMRLLAPVKTLIITIDAPNWRKMVAGCCR